MWQTPIGWLAATATDAGVRTVTSHQPTRDDAEDAIFPAQLEGDYDPDAFAPTRAIINRFLAAEPVDMREIPIDVSGVPPLIAAAWHACRTIPPAQTRSYSWLAYESGYPGAHRAAGQAMKKNRLGLLVPCHRVIRADGSIGGYGGGEAGLHLKERLIEIEKSPDAPPLTSTDFGL